MTGVRGAQGTALALALTLALVLAGCRSSRPAAGPPPAPSAPGWVYAAVGSSETVGSGAEQPLRDAWPQVLYRTSLPASAVFVNLAAPNATVAQALATQVPQAEELVPTLVTVWLNSSDLLAGTPTDAYERDLGEIVRRLRRGGAAKVLVASMPPLARLPAAASCRPDPPGSPPCRAPTAFPPPDVLALLSVAYDEAVNRVASANGAVVVPLGGITYDAVTDGLQPNTATQRAVAEAFASALR